MHVRPEDEKQLPPVTQELEEAKVICILVAAIQSTSSQILLSDALTAVATSTVANTQHNQHRHRDCWANTGTEAMTTQTHTDTKTNNVKHIQDMFDLCNVSKSF